MAAGLGFKDFATGEVLTAADVDGYLMQGIWVFASAAARSAAVTSPQEGNFSFLKDTNSTEYYNGSAWVSAAPAGGGKVLQVVSATTTTATTIAVASMTDTTITATITPTLATSKILVLVSANAKVSRSAVDAAGGAILLRGATTILDYFPSSSPRLTKIEVGGATSVDAQTQHSISILDAPNTTSATTYKLQALTEKTASSGQIVFQASSSPSTITLMEIGV
jgi:hypothetical protein